MFTANGQPLGKLTLSKMVCVVSVFCATAAIASPAQGFTTLLNFTGGNGANPQASLIQGTDGNFYGTTLSGGTSNNCGSSGCGTVFKITPSGALTTLQSFHSSDGASPQAGLLQATDGNLYGTTSEGGVDFDGTVFKITPSGTLTTLHTFKGTDGSFPTAGLVQATDGNFYGTASNGGANCGSVGCGTVFKITPSGTLTTLHSFAGGDGALPNGLVQANDGNFYGTTYTGGANNYGTVFKITSGGTLTTLYSFDFSHGTKPSAALVQATDGNFYGTTSEGGASSNCGSAGCGTIFKITPSGTLTTLHNFSGGDGAAPVAGLVQATDGNFYGTTYGGGTYSVGTVFKITASGTLTTLHSFDSSDGARPQAGLVQATDSNFYGTAYFGGADNDGTVFKLQLIYYTLTVSTSGNGTVTSTDGFINCPGTCSHSYLDNTPVTLNATPAQGWSFAGWSGDCSRAPAPAI